MSVKLATHVFGIALALLPLGLIATVLTSNGAFFALAVILAVETVLGSVLFTVWQKYFKKRYM